MFERYTLPARRAVFESYREARSRGASEIGAAHLLLGVMTADARLLRLLVGDTACSALRSAVEAVTPTLGTASEDHVDLPLSSEATKALELAEQERMSTELLEVRPGHLVAEILQTGSPSANVLAEHGVTLEAARRAANPEQ
jgi:ATP-dependent Clp protease ATP-binding subunit ClpA